MFQRCPLMGEGVVGAYVDVPEYCSERCGIAMEHASERGKGYENYDDCGHDSALDTSGEKVRAVGHTAQREYVIIDRCGDCGKDVLDTTVPFTCMQQMPEGF